MGSGVASPSAFARVALHRRLVWGLDATAEGSTCAGCKACRRHAANKIFRTAKAAQREKAHKHCNCRVVKLGSVSHATWAALFLRPHGVLRTSVDRRTPRVRRIVKAAPLHRIHR